LIFDGEDIFKLKDHKLAQFRNLKIGFVFQFHHLLPEFTALENVCIPAFIAKKSVNESEKRAMELLDLLGLTGRAQHKPAELSGGEQQRVAVARALASHPRFVLADEPTASLDTTKAFEVVELLARETRERGKATIMVTHDERLIGYCDKVYEMHDGVLTERKAHKKQKV